MLNLHRLRLLVTLRSVGTMAAVADATGYSTSAVSQQLLQLERETGVALLRKEGRGVALTHAAHELCQQAEVMIAQSARAEALLANWRSGERSTVVVVMDSGVVDRCLPGFMHELRRSDPEIRVVVQQATPTPQLSELGGVDAWVTMHYPGQPSPLDTQQASVELARDDLVLCSPPEWLVDDFTMADPYPWVMGGQRSGSRAWTERLVRSAGLHPRVQYELDAPRTQIELVESGLCLAVVPSAVAGAVVHRASLAGSPQVTIRATMTRATARTRRMEAVCEAMRVFLSPDAPQTGPSAALR